MAGEGFLAGSVLVRVEPDTRGFARKVREALEKIDDATLDLNFRVDDAMADAAYRKWNGRNGYMDFVARVDDRQLRNLQTAGQKLRDDWAKKPVEISTDTKKARDAADAWWDKFTSTEKSITDRHAKELKDREAAEAKSLKDRQANLQKFYEKNMKDFFKGKGLKSFDRLDLDNLYGESISGGDRIHTQIKKLKDSLRDLRKIENEHRIANSGIQDWMPQADTSHLKTYSKQLQDLDYVQKSIVDNETALGKALKSSREIYQSDPDRMAKVVRSFKLADSAIAKMVGRSEESMETWQKMTRAMGDVDTKTVVRDLGKATASVKKFAMAEDTAAASATKIKRLMTEQSERINRARDDYKHYGDTVVKAHKYGLDGLEKHKKAMADMNKVIATHEKALTNLRKQYTKLGSDRYKIAVELETKRFDEEMARVGRSMASLDQRVEVEIHARVYDDAADDLQRQLEVLKRQHITIPVDVEVDVQNTVAKMRQVAQSIREGEEVDFDVDVDIDDMNARRKLRDLQNDYDEMKMDVDVETALARAHLAYFTRPRTVDIFARFRGTDMGKILAGMTSGATGIQGVQNQFQRLVNLFDNFDTIIPKVSAIGTVLAGIGAGAINLSGSVLGVGASIVKMSKVALAAPAALTGLGAAYASLRMIIGEEGAAWKENISLAGTAMEDMSERVQKAFYGKAAPAITDLANSIGEVLVPQMESLAEHEGLIVEGLAKVITEGNNAGQLEKIFGNVNSSLDKMTPGIEDLVRAFVGLGDTTSEYLPRAASYMSDLAGQFADWVTQAQQTGAITAALGEVVEQAGYLKNTFKGVMDIASGLYSGLAESQNGIESFSQAVEHAGQIVNGMRFQETLQAWADGASDAKENMRGSFSEIGDAAYQLRNTTADVFRDAGSTLGSFSRNVSRLLKNSKSGISDFSSGVSQGFQKLFDAVGDVSPMFDQLLSTAGQLSKTFGGTLASSLKAASPIIESLAKSASVVAEAFSKLPSPVQAAIGMWATFGKAGVNAFNSLKVGLLETTEKTLKYKSMLSQLGIDAGNAGVSMAGAVKGFTQVNSTLGSIGSAVSAASGPLSKIGAAASAAFSAVNWPLTGIITGVGLAAAALFDYQEKAESNRQVSENLAAAFAKVGDEGFAAANGTNAIISALQDALDNPDLGEQSWLDDVFSGVNETKDAMRTLGITAEDAISVATGSTKNYEKEMERLTGIINEGTKVADVHGTTMSGGAVQYTKSAQAAKKYRQSLEALTAKYKEAAEEQAQENGYAEGYATSLIDAGISAEELAVKISTLSQQQKMASTAMRMLTDDTADQSTAARNAMSAASSYQSTLEGVEKTAAGLSQITDLQNKVWNDSSKLLPGVTGAFNVMTEEGRNAQSTLETLGAAAQDYMEKMVTAGMSAEDVKAQVETMNEEFVAQAHAMGVPEDAAEQLATAYGLIPSKVDTLINVRVDEAREAIATFLANLHAMFPDDGKVIECVLNMAMNGDIDSITDAYEKVEKLRNNKDVKLLLSVDGENATSKLDEIKGALKTLTGVDTSVKIDVNSAEGTAKLESIQDKLRKLGMSEETIKVIIDALGAEQGFLSLYDSINNKTATLGMDADTEPARAKTAAFISEGSGTKRVPLDVDPSAADGQLVTYAAVDAPAKRVPVEAVENPATSVATVVARIAAAIIPPKQVVIQGEAQQAWNVINAVAAYGSKTIATPWARVQGENNGAKRAFKDTAAYDGRTIARPWGRVQGENNGAKRAFQDTAWYDGMTIARPWGRVQGDASHVQSVFASIASKNGTTLATRYVDIVTRSSGSVKAATGGRIHGAGTGTSDSIPAMLSNGEHVVRAAAVRKLDSKVGPNFLNALNLTGDVEYALAHAGAAYVKSASNLAKAAYANGGRVRDWFNGNVTVTVPDAGTTVNQQFNLQTKVVRADQDLQASAQIMTSGLMRRASREARRV